MIGDSQLGHSGEVIDHVQFKGDTIIFNLARREEVLSLKRILSCFQLVLGSKVNISKSLLVGIGVLRGYHLVLGGQHIIHCRSSHLPIIFLGLSIRAKLRSRCLWDSVIDKFERKLSICKKQYLFLGEGLLWLRLVCLIFRCTICHSSKCQRWWSRGWIVPEETSYGRIRVIGKNWIH